MTRLKSIPLLAATLAGAPGLLYAQGSPFLTGVTSLQENILEWLTPVAIILVMVLGGMAMAWAFGWSAKDMLKPDYGYTAFGPIGGVFVLGIGMLVLGIPLMLACFAFGTKRFFRGETLNANSEVKVPDVF